MPTSTSEASEPDRPLRPTAVEVWLRHEHLPRSERIDRLAGDADLEASLRAQGFQGDDWDFVVNVLAEYGISVIAGWISRGLIVSKCAEKNIRVPALPDRIRRNYDYVNDIAVDTVGDAINHFRDDVLVPGVWQAERGASLKTFFIGQCMRRYANAARRWTRQYEPPGDVDPTDDSAILNAGRVSNVEDDVIRHVTAQRILEGVGSERAARALSMDALKYRNVEIAADLGISLEATKSLIRRARADIRKHHLSTGGSTA